jgi:hypothetical protein
MFEKFCPGRRGPAPAAERQMDLARGREGPVAGDAAATGGNSAHSG